MAGRKTDCHVVGLQIYTYLPIYNVSYQPIIPEGARRTYHDGTRLLRLVDTRLAHGIQVLKKDFEKCKERLASLGYEKIKGTQMTTSFPRYCPKCDRSDGYPHLRLIKKALSKKDENFRSVEKATFQVYYSHSKPKYHQCFIGYWSTDNKIRLAKGIDIRKMSPFYFLREGQTINMPLPDKEMKKPEVLQ